MTQNLTNSEIERLAIVRDYRILDTEPEQGFDDVSKLAAQICQTPIASVSIVDRDRIWFKSKYGFEHLEINREATFCNETIKQKNLYIVSIKQNDKRFAHFPHVSGAENDLSFYAGVPLINPKGFVIGTLSVLDHRQRKLNKWQKEALIALARQVEAQFELRYQILKLEETVDKVQRYSEKILQTQERYRSVVDNLKEVIFQTDANGCWIFLNPAWTEITGFSVDESLGEEFLKYVHPQDRELNARLFEPLINREKDYCRHEIRYLTKDKSFRWMEVFARLTTNEKDEVIGTSGTLNDITERKFAEESLKKETFYVSLLQSATDAANEAKSVEEAIKICLDKICELMDWSVGHLFNVSDKTPTEIVSTKIWSIKDFNRFSSLFHETQNLIIQPGNDLPGQAFSQKSAVWSCHLTTEPLFSRHAMVKDLGIQSGFAFPVMIGSKIIAILEFFTDKLIAPDEKFLEVMRHIGIQLGRIIERKRAEENLRQSEERFRAISETSPLGIFLTDKEGACIYMNKRLEELSGYLPDDFFGFNWMQSVHYDDLKQLYNEWETKGKIGEYNFVYRLVKKDGLIIWANAHSAPIKVNGKILGYVGMVENVTERKNFEHILRESEERYRDLFEKANDLIQSVGIDGKFIYVNPAWREKLGYTEKEVKSLSIWDIIHPDCKDDCLEMFEKVISGQTSGTVETVFSAKDGRAINVEGTINVKRTNMKPTATLAIFRDVTDRKIIEIALRESEERYRIVAESANDAIITVDNSGKILFVNSATERIFGYHKDELISQNLTILMPEHFRKGHLVTLRRLVKTSVRKMPWKGAEVPARHKNGREIIMEISFGEYQRNDEHLFTGIIRDITERKKIAAELQQAKEVAEAATQAKSQFLANMSHEIRTPMNSIIGLTGILLESDIPVEKKELLETVNHSAEALLTIINDILDFSKIEAGKLELEIIEFELNKTISEVYNLFTEQSLSGNNRLNFEIAPNVSRLMKGDPFRLRQILTNLVSNALKFTTNGKITIKVEVKNETDLDSTILFKVSDTGIGIPEEKCQRLFKAFSQADGSITRRFGGTGLGLAISKQLVEFMNGEIGVESEVGKGSTFWFTAQFNKISNAELHSAKTKDLSSENIDFTFKNDSFEKNPLKQKSATLNPKILVADDNAINQKVALLMLKSLGYQADVAANGLEVLEALRKQPYDVVLMDVQMPEMDGVEATRNIRREWNGKEKPYIIALTANAMRGDRELCLAAGMDDYLSKPIRKEELQVAIEKCQLQNIQANKNTSVDKNISVDFTILESLKSYSTDNNEFNQIVGELIQIFSEDIPVHLSNLRKFYSENNFEQLAGISHSMKGVCATLGAVNLSLLSSTIEKKSRLGSLTGIEQILNQMEIEFKVVLDLVNQKYRNGVDTKNQ